MGAWVDHFNALGFRIEQCALAAAMLDIDPGDFLPAVKVVENGYISLIGYQQQGFALVPMD
jgi:intracellular sulfur oxidation DsrE/DsrF family protein